MYYVKSQTAIVVTFSGNIWLSISIRLHMCGALPSPQCRVKQILVLAIIIINIGGGTATSAPSNGVTSIVVQI